MFSDRDRIRMPQRPLPDRDTPLIPSEPHLVFGRRLDVPAPPGFGEIWFGMGCFWGAERRFWQVEGVWLTAVGYAGGVTAHPSYEDVCSGRTGHAEVVRVIWDPDTLRLGDLLRVFWEVHDPTQGMRQGNDVGTQYRSAIYTLKEADLQLARRSRRDYEAALQKAGLGRVTTEIRAAGTFYYAETYHQQYLVRHPDGYCGLQGTGVPCP
ncbi:MAG: peptide-methionine (S)-S-oxide reductase MsrA [Candidatus Dadabacteria bacterium]|nr:MAG: peptide-methionine (S)-S-oxide reductase MsrA [Candidatus Dadabacteria bacterium]